MDMVFVTTIHHSADLEINMLAADLCHANSVKPRRQTFAVRRGAFSTYSRGTPRRQLRHTSYLMRKHSKQCKKHSSVVALDCVWRAPPHGARS